MPPSYTTPAQRRSSARRLGVLVRSSIAALVTIAILLFSLVIGPAAPATPAKAQATNQPQVTIQNLDGVPYTDRLVTSRIQNGETGDRIKCDDTVVPPVCKVVPKNEFHDTSTLRVRNTGAAPLLITGVISGPWKINNSITVAQQTIAPNTFLDLPIKFTYNKSSEAGVPNDGFFEGSLTLTTNDPAQPTITVQLAGFWQFQSERRKEPSLDQIVKLFGYTTVVSEAGKVADDRGEAVYRNRGVLETIGDEVLSDYWRRSDPIRPVSVYQLVAYHSQGSDAEIFWHAKGSSTKTRILIHEGVDGQTVLPRLRGQQTVATKEFVPSSPIFGFNIDNEWSDHKRNPGKLDTGTGCMAGTAVCGHHMRFFPARDRQGITIPDTWLVTMDYRAINYDYQDNVYLISNIRPESEVASTGVGLLPGSPNLVLDFNRSYPGTLADKDNQTTGFLSTQRNKLDQGTGSNSYNKALLDIDTSGAGTLKITTTEGSNRNDDNTLVNGLVLPFNASLQSFVIATRILGPLSNLDSGFRQSGIMFGPSQDNFIKLVALAGSGGPAIEFVMEQDGGTPVPGSSVALPNAATLQSLDLKLYGDPKTGIVRASYRAVAPGQDSGEVFFAQQLTLTDLARARFFGDSVGGGVLTTHKGTATPISLRFDRFAVENTEKATGQVLYRIDTGTSSGRAPLSGWRSDSQPSKLYVPSNAIDEPKSPTSAGIANTDDDKLYQTYRGNVGNVPQASRIITYNIPLAQPQRVDLRLHFAELFWGTSASGTSSAAGQRVFDVVAEGQPILTDFDIGALAGAPLTALVVTIKGVDVSDGNLTLAFKAQLNYASIAGIEVLTAGNDSPTPTPVPENRPPVANADGPQSAPPGGQVTLDGSSSSDPDGDALSYSWSQLQGPAVTLNATGAQATFSAPNASGQLVFLLTVTDARGATATDTVVVTLLQPGETPTTTPVPGNKVPVAVAGAPITVVAGGQVTLDGSSSSDPDGDVLSYSWMQVQGPAVTLNATGTQATFSAPSASGQLVFLLTVTDARGATATDAVVVTLLQPGETPTTTPVPGNKVPVAVAGAPITVAVGGQVTLDGSSSSDPDGDVLSYSWIQVQGPAVTLNANGAQATFSAPSATGQLVFLLTVSDGRGGQDVATIQVTVQQGQGTPNPQVYLPLINMLR